MAASAFAPEVQAIFLGDPVHLDKEIQDYIVLSRKVADAPEGDLVIDDPDVAALQEKNYNELLEDFNKAIGLRPDNAEAYYNRGLLYQAEKQHRARGVQHVGLRDLGGGALRHQRRRERDYGSRASPQRPQLDRPGSTPAGR